MLVVSRAQEREDRTLLPQKQMTATINEVAGEEAMHTVLELVPYQRVRRRSPEVDIGFRRFVGNQSRVTLMLEPRQ